MFSLINNLGSIESQTSLNRTSASLNTTIQQLSSGLRINNSGDDAAGLAIANSFRNQIAGIAPGSDVALSILRDNHEQQIHAKLGEFSEKAGGIEVAGGSSDSAA